VTADNRALAFPCYNAKRSRLRLGAASFFSSGIIAVPSQDSGKSAALGKLPDAA